MADQYLQPTPPERSTPESARHQPGQEVVSQKSNAVPIDQVITALSRLLPDQPALREVVVSIASDEKHPLNLTAALKDAKRHVAVLEALGGIAASRSVSEQEFLRTVGECVQLPQYRFCYNQDQFNYDGINQRTLLHKRRLLDQNSALFSIAEEGGPREMRLLRQYMESLQTSVLPELFGLLREVAGEEGDDGYPMVSVRAKSKDGVLDKISRMRGGIGYKAPRPEYCLADMPDAVGGRITVTVKPAEVLDQLMQSFEQSFRLQIVEKDSFYANPVKRNHPYRVVTYTLVVEETACEVQLTTLLASVAADLVHNVIYKPLVPIIPSQRAAVEEFARKAVVYELEGLRAKVVE